MESFVEYSLIVVLGIVIGIVGYTAFLKTAIYVLQRMAMHKMNKEYKKYEQERQAMLDKGETHDWINILGFNVCKKTGYSPEKGTYFSKEAIKAFERIKKQEEEAKEYYNDKIKDVAAKHDLSVEKIETIVTEASQIKKDWHLNLMDKSLKDINDKIEKIKVK